MGGGGEGGPRSALNPRLRPAMGGTYAGGSGSAARAGELFRRITASGGGGWYACGSGMADRSGGTTLLALVVVAVVVAAVKPSSGTYACGSVANSGAAAASE
jgi:hypothetical protein